jgi:hypothetical protein
MGRVRVDGMTAMLGRVESIGRIQFRAKLLEYSTKAKIQSSGRSSFLLCDATVPMMMMMMILIYV